MSWRPAHPGGVITCDHQGCTRERRYYCPPGEAAEWRASWDGRLVHDLCPAHKPGDEATP